jgi:hypothetical protein
MTWGPMPMSIPDERGGVGWYPAAVPENAEMGLKSMPNDAAMNRGVSRVVKGHDVCP